MTVQLERMVVYNTEPENTKSHVLSITWSREVTWEMKNVIFTLPWRLWVLNLTEWWCLMRRGHHPQWSHDTTVTQKSNKFYISISTGFMATKLDKVMTYDVGPPRAKSHGFLITWSYVVSWQIKNVISPIPQAQWASNLTGWCFMTWGHHSKNHISLSKKFFPFINYSLL